MFNDLKGNGRIWIYTSKRKLSIPEVEKITAKVKSFCEGWAAHGSSLKSDFKIFNDQFLVLAVDEDFEAASGCSIDSSVQVFREIDQAYNLDLFNRLNLGFLIADQVKIIRLAELNTAHQQGQIDSNSILIDNTISTLDQLRTDWHKPLSKSWAANKVKHLA